MKEKLATLALSALIFGGCSRSEKNPEDCGHSYDLDLTKIGKEAIAISAGEDHIWSDEEKVEFFQDNGLRDFVISEGDGVHLIYITNCMEVYSGPGSSRTSYGESRANKNAGNYSGSISRKQLEKYVLGKTLMIKDTKP